MIYGILANPSADPFSKIAIIFEPMVQILCLLIFRMSEEKGSTKKTANHPIFVDKSLSSLLSKLIIFFPFLLNYGYIWAKYSLIYIINAQKA